MTAMPVPPGAPLRVVLGVGRARVLSLRLAYQGHDHVRVIASCAAASEVLSVLERGDADGAILDEELHGLDRARLALLKERRSPLVLLSRRPEAAQWQGLAGRCCPSRPTLLTSCSRCGARCRANTHRGVQAGGRYARQHRPHRNQWRSLNPRQPARSLRVMFSNSNSNTNSG